MSSTRPAVAGLALAIVVALAVACGSGSELATRQAVVAEAGAQVMPFDLDQTTHIFTDTATGGIQDVVADDPSDAATIDQIRLHLLDEVDKFNTGDFSDPEAIHGAGMPGLDILKERYREVLIDLTQTRLGATLTYTAEDPALVSAIHSWFGAQTRDHGAHAEGHG